MIIDGKIYFDEKVFLSKKLKCKTFEMSHLIDFHDYSKIRCKKEIVNCVSVIRNYQSFSDVLAAESK